MTPRKLPKSKYEGFEALNPWFEVVQKGLAGLVDGKHFFDMFADGAVFESLYKLPGWPMKIRGRANLMADLSGYGDNIQLHSSDHLIVHHSRDDRVVILEYQVHGKVVITIESRKIVYWRDYMDSLAVTTALAHSSSK